VRTVLEDRGVLFLPDILLFLFDSVASSLAAFSRFPTHSGKNEGTHEIEKALYKFGVGRCYVVVGDCICGREGKPGDQSGDDSKRYPIAGW
jgi:hypothetical protein